MVLFNQLKTLFIDMGVFMDYYDEIKTLAENIKIGFIMYLIFSLLAIIFSALTFIWRRRITSKFLNKTLLNFIIYIIVIISISVSVFLGFKAKNYYLDYNDIKNFKNYTIITAEVIGYDKENYSENSGQMEYSYPILKIECSEKTIILNIGPTELGKKYTIIYTERTNAAIIVE